MKKMIIAANLGNLRVLKYREPGEDPIEQEHLIEAESAKCHVDAIHQSVTDQAGRFPGGTAAGMETGMSYGEENHLKAEIQRVALKKIAEHVLNALRSEGNPAWILAAPQTILGSLQDMLPADVRRMMISSVGADLTRCPLPEMEARFL